MEPLPIHYPQKSTISWNSSRDNGFLEEDSDFLVILDDSAKIVQRRPPRSLLLALFFSELTVRV
jgi:hypothetical protein